MTEAEAWVTLWDVSERASNAWLACVEDALRKLGLTRSAKIAAHGGQAALFRDPRSPRWLVRLEPVWHVPRATLDKKVAEFRKVHAALERAGVTPGVKDVHLFPGADGGKSSLFAMRIEAVDIIQWKSWRSHFKNSPLRLTHAVFALFRTMADAGVAHTDASPNNIVLLRDGRIMAIDIFDACRHRCGSLACSDEPRGYTAGYADLAALGKKRHEVWPKYKRLYSHFFSEADVRKAVAVSSWTFEHHLENASHNAGMLILDVLGGLLDPMRTTAAMLRDKRRFPDEVQRLVALAIHPDRRRRTLEVPKKAAPEGLNAGGVGRAAAPVSLTEGHGLAVPGKSSNGCCDAPAAKKRSPAKKKAAGRKSGADSKKRQHKKRPSRASNRDKEAKKKAPRKKRPSSKCTAAVRQLSVSKAARVMADPRASAPQKSRAARVMACAARRV